MISSSLLIVLWERGMMWMDWGNRRHPVVMILVTIGATLVLGKIRHIAMLHVGLRWHYERSS